MKGSCGEMRPKRKITRYRLDHDSHQPFGLYRLQAQHGW